MDTTIMIIALLMFIGIVVSWFLLPGSTTSTATVTETEAAPVGVPV